MNMMQLFSERLGYIKPSDIIVREDMPEAVANAIASSICRLRDDLETADDEIYGCIQNVPYYDLSYFKLKAAFWTDFLNKKYTELFDSDFGRDDEITLFLTASSAKWYRKLDCVEFLIDYMGINFTDKVRVQVVERFVSRLNYHFERLRYGYRIIDGYCTDITSKEEISTISKAVCACDIASSHLRNALSLYSQRPTPDYTNSIKESISAVEAFCREKTGESTLGPALSKLETNGITIQPMLRSAFEKLYYYTNDKTTGIRHALMDSSETYKPSEDEAGFMLIACSSFINYLKKKSGRP